MGSHEFKIDWVSLADVLQRAVDLSREAELFVVVGTSSVVQPAAMLPDLASQAGAYVVEVNPEATPLSPLAQEHHRGPAGALLPALLGAETS